MSSREPQRSSTGALVPVLLVGVLAGCASPSLEPSPPDRRSGVLVASPSWLNGALAAESSQDPNAVRAAAANPALRPSGPWVGTIGVCKSRPGDYEWGLGLCVPDPFPSRVQPTAAPPERTRELGVGCWLSFDF